MLCSSCYYKRLAENVHTFTYGFYSLILNKTLAYYVNVNNRENKEIILS